jgi:hypothetical protein
LAAISAPHRFILRVEHPVAELSISMTAAAYTMWPAAISGKPWDSSRRRSLPDVMSGLTSLLCFLIVLLLLASNVGVDAATGPTVGMVTKIENQAKIGAETAVVGTLVHMNDELRTGPKAHLEVTFRDKTTLTLGENAKLTIDRYVFKPDESTAKRTSTSPHPPRRWQCAAPTSGGDQLTGNLVCSL